MTSDWSLFSFFIADNSNEIAAGTAFCNFTKTHVFKKGREKEQNEIKSICVVLWALPDTV